MLLEIVGLSRKTSYTHHISKADLFFKATWRLPFGESGILELFFRILGIESISDELAVHSLRLIGNSCSDTGGLLRCLIRMQSNGLLDENRSRVVDGNALSLIIRRLANPRLVAVAVPVLFNICADFGMTLSTSILSRKQIGYMLTNNRPSTPTS